MPGFIGFIIKGKTFATVAVTVFLLIMSPTKFRWVHNQRENCHFDRVPFNLKIIRKRFLSVYILWLLKCMLKYLNWSLCGIYVYLIILCILWSILHLIQYNACTKRTWFSLTFQNKRNMIVQTSFLSIVNFLMKKKIASTIISLLNEELEEILSCNNFLIVVMIIFLSLSKKT